MLCSGLILFDFGDEIDRKRVCDFTLVFHAIRKLKET